MHPPNARSSPPPLRSTSWHGSIADADLGAEFPFLGYFIEVAEQLLADADQRARPFWRPGRALL